MSDPTKWRYGTRLRSGRWIWPRGCWEYDLELAKVAALRTFPHASVVGVEPMTDADGIVRRWIHETNKGWASATSVTPAAPATSSSSAENMWWRDRD